MRAKWLESTALATCLTLLAAASALSSAGALDDTFSGDGRKSFHQGSRDTIRDVKVMDDQRILVAGFTSQGEDTSTDVFVARLEADGDMDGDFGDGGRFDHDFGSGQSDTNDSFEALAVDNQDRVIAVGERWSADGTRRQMLIVRLTADGELDTTFGGDHDSSGHPDGYRIIDFPNMSGGWARDVLVLGNNKPLAFGAAYTAQDELRPVIVRLTTGGDLDTGFSTDGKAFLPVAYGVLESVARYDSNRFVGALQGCCDDMSAVRFDSDGTLDGSFGSGGVASIAFASGDSESVDIAVDDGRVVVAGHVHVADGDPDDDDGWALARFRDDGAPDASFGDGGRSVTPFGSTVDWAESVAIQSDGRIVVAGWKEPASSLDDFTVARYLWVGALDTSFSNDGVAVVEFDDDGHAYALAIQPDDGRILAGGRTSDEGTGDDDFAIARLDDGRPLPPYQPDAIIDGIGDNVFDAAGSRQRKNRTVARGATGTCAIVIENNGSHKDTFRVRGPGDAGAFDAQYLKGATGSVDISSSVVAGTYRLRGLFPGERRTLRLRVRVRAGATSDTVRSWVVKATSSANGNADAVTCRITVA